MTTFFVIVALIIIFTYGYFTLDYFKTKKKLIKLENQIPTVLIVDDDPDNIELLSIMLDDICKFEVVTTGEISVEMCKKKVYPVILMDINLGNGMNGIDAANIIKTYDGYEDVYIIALTSFKPKDIMVEFGKSFQYFIQKPYDKEFIRELVKGLLIQTFNKKENI